MVAVSGIALTRLLQLVSPALPIGAFAYSQGLEQAVASGWVTDEATAAEWLIGLLDHALATLDLPVLERLIDAWRADDLERVTAWSVWLAACRARRAEMRAEERQLGAALARALTAVGLADAAGWEAREDVTLGRDVRARHRALRDPDVSGAGRVRLRLGRGHDQRRRPPGPARSERRAAPARGRRRRRSPARSSGRCDLADDELASTAPGQAIASALHETLYSRLFRS